MSNKDWKKLALTLTVLLRAKCSDEEWANMGARFAATFKAACLCPECGGNMFDNTTFYRCVGTCKKAWKAIALNSGWVEYMAATPQVTPQLKDILKQYGAHHIRDCDALNKWKKLPCDCGFAALLEGTSEQASSTRDRNTGISLDGGKTIHPKFKND